MKHLIDITDYFVICEGENIIHTKAIADTIEETLEKEKIFKHHREGYEHGRWILLDYIDVIVHIFLKEIRQYYNIEDLWADAHRIAIL